ncbi:tetraspanin-8 isoform X2 [Amia ocellicauda]|uniref:tetraspanin-8 isoform X2 n=1 Tax=Amia ocellicauda TaxID=2972642 RepID=UPI003463EE88
MAHINYCLKGLLVTFNILLTLVGIVFLLFGIHFQNAAEGHTGSSKGMCILIAVVTVAFGLFGLFGAKSENQCMLKGYSTGMALCVIMLVILGIWFASQKSKVFVAFKSETEKLIPLDVKGDEMRKELDQLQAVARCCGLVNGYKDWGSQIPDSCDCTSGSSDCINVEGQSRRVYAQFLGMLLSTCAARQLKQAAISGVTDPHYAL